jgi:hypothetical protein
MMIIDSRTLRSLRTRRAPDARAGGALVLSLVAVLMVSVLAAGFMQLGSSLARRQGHAATTKEAFYLAEAGLAEAYTGLAEARTGNVGSEERPAVFGDGLFWVEATEDDPGIVELEATGMVGSGRVTLGMAVERDETSLASLGIFAIDSVEVQAGSLIDGYDSRKGSYGDQVVAGTNGGMGSFGSNGDVTVNGGGGALLDGDVTPGVSGSVDTTGSVTITGSSLPRAEEVSLPSVRVPPVTLDAPILHGEAVPLVIPSGTSGFESLRLVAKGSVIIVGPATVVLGTLEAAAGCDIFFDTTGGPIDLFVKDSMNLASGSTLTCSDEDPTQVTIQIAGDGASQSTLAASTSFYGFVYAPETKLQMASDFELFGGLLAKQLGLAAGQRLHYDHALTGGAQGRPLPQLISWRVVDIPAAVAARGSDPFLLLGVDRGSLPAPVAAHEDQWLEIDYRDKNGFPQSYTGWESNFDWSGVGWVEDIERDGEDALDPALSALEKMIQDPAIDSSQLKDELLDRSPLADSTMLSAITRDPAMDGSHLRDVLTANSPLSDQVLTATIDSGTLSSSALKDVLLASSPLSPSLRDRVASGGTTLSTSDQEKVLSAQ